MRKAQLAAPSERYSGVVIGVRAALAAVAVMIVASPNADAGASSTCRASGADRVVLRSAHAVVVEQRHGGQRGVYFACFRPRNVFYNVGLNAGRLEPKRVRVVRLAGYYVGVLQYSLTRGGNDVTVRVYDLRNGHLAHLAGISDGHAEGEPSHRVDGSDLQLKTDGAVAWVWRIEDLAADGVHWTNRRYEVRKSDPNGGNKLLDRGGQIKAGSLRLSGSTLRWLDGGAVRTGTLR